MAKKVTESRSTVQANTNVDFQLHSLGWKAFQDLCLTVLRETLGQTVQTFFDSNDGGRDGAFAGTWKTKKREVYSGTFTIQCKFTGKRDKQLSTLSLADEKEKAKRLGSKGLSNIYILMTNAKVTGTTDEKLKEEFESYEGIEAFLVFGHEWLSRQIQESAKLRMLVPRTYGLGDLSQILDSRAYHQATEILNSLGDDFRKFVITDAHRKSAKAISEHGFVMLLGEPASGKSTIAAALAVASIDRWGCTPLIIRDADDFVTHSNPHEKQFFWVDDAFGATQFEMTAAEKWNRAFPHVKAAIQRGARVLFTSRDYIFQSAIDHLKTSVFPPLDESKVVIHVDKLTEGERDQILYNHIKLGTQKKTFRVQVKPFLPSVARHVNFKPETARRLGNPRFTLDLKITHSSIARFVAHPLEHSIEVIDKLDAESKSALAVVFMRGGALPVPVDFTPEEESSLQRMGGSLAGVRKALRALNNSFVLRVSEEDSQMWKFKHPTIRDAFASIIAADPELLDIYLAGASPDQMLDEVSCGDMKVSGVKVVIPKNRYGKAIDQFESLDFQDIGVRWRFYRFLTNRCDRRFIQAYIQRHPSLTSQLRAGFSAEASLIARLSEDKLLPEVDRQRFVDALGRSAIDAPDADFLDPKYRRLFTKPELALVLNNVRDELLPNLDSVVDNLRDAYMSNGQNGDPEDHFESLVESLNEYAIEFSEDCCAMNMITESLESIETTMNELKMQFHPLDRGYDDVDDDRSESPVQARTIFDDVDE